MFAVGSICHHWQLLHKPHWVAIIVILLPFRVRDRALFQLENCEVVSQILAELVSGLWTSRNVRRHFDIYMRPDGVEFEK